MDALFGGSTSIASHRQSAGEPCMLTGSAVPRIYKGVLKSGKSPWRRYVCLGVVIGGATGSSNGLLRLPPLRPNHQVNRCGPGGDSLPAPGRSFLPQRDTTSGLHRPGTRLRPLRIPAPWREGLSSAMASERPAPSGPPPVAPRRELHRNPHQCWLTEQPPPRKTRVVQPLSGVLVYSPIARLTRATAGMPQIVASRRHPKGLWIDWRHRHVVAAGSSSNCFKRTRPWGNRTVSSSAPHVMRF